MKVWRIRHCLSTAALCAAVMSGCVGSTPSPAQTPPPLSPTVTPSPIGTPTPPPSPTPTLQIHFPAWSGAPGYPEQAFLLYGEFGYAEVVQNPYKSGVPNPVKLYLTYDGGESWVDRTPPAETSTGFLYIDLHFADPLHAWFVENVYDTIPEPEVKEHLLFRTADGGQTWTKCVVPIPSSFVASELDMADGVNGLIITQGNGQTQNLWRTGDGGATWTQVIDVPYDPKSDFPEQPTMVTATEGWAMGFDLASGGKKVLHTIDGAATWQSKGSLPLPDGVDSVYAIDPAPLWAHRESLVSGADFSVGGWVTIKSSWEYVVWVSRDKGATWAIDSTKLMTSRSPRPAYPGVYYTGLNVGANSVEYFDIRNLGSTALFDPSGACGDGLRPSLQFLKTPEEAWAACSHEASGFVDHSYLYSTKDGGRTWMPMMGAP